MVIDLERVAPEALPAELAVAAVTFAELAAGPHAATDSTERARRQERLQRAEATFDAIPFDAAAARADLPLLTRNASDFAGLDRLSGVTPVPKAAD